MTEILTESFCERCGTRYTFESPRPKLRLKGVKVVSRGLKNFVLSDGTSMDEAMAAARSETEREATSYQLDAFHKTFNFCMQCRQYTCPNCWNEAEVRCLTCAPHLGHEILPAPFPDLPSSASFLGGDATGGGAIIVDGVSGTNGTNGASGANGVHAEPTVEVEPPDADFDLAARLDALTIVASPTPGPGADLATAGAVVAQTVETPEPVASVEPAVESVAAGPEVTGAPEVVAETVEPAQAAAAVAPEVVAETVEPAQAAAAAAPEVVAETVEPAQAAAAAAPEIAADPAPVAKDHEAAKLAALGAAAAVIADGPADDAAATDPASASRFTGMFGRYRPGQDLDAELDAYEREQAATAAAAASAAAIVAAPATGNATGEPAHAPEPAIAAAPEAAAIAETPSVVETSPPAVAEPETIAPAAVIEAAPAETPPAAAPEATMTAAPEVAAATVVSQPVAVQPVAVQPVAAEPVPAETGPRMAEVVAAAAIVDDAPLPAETQPGAGPVAGPEPTPIAAALEAEPPAESATDVIAQPTWQRVAPDPASAPPIAPPPVQPPAAAPGPEPQWPSRPAWLGSAPSVGLPFLGRSATPQGGVEALWAESNREVANPPSAAKPAAVQPCVSCGLSLSGTARFCRRCGTAQPS